MEMARCPRCGYLSTSVCEVCGQPAAEGNRQCSVECALKFVEMELERDKDKISGELKRRLGEYRKARAAAGKV